MVRAFVQSIMNFEFVSPARNEANEAISREILSYILIPLYYHYQQQHAYRFSESTESAVGTGNRYHQLKLY